MMMRRIALAATVAFAALSGCDSDSPTALQPEGEQPACLEFYRNGPRIEVPAVGAVGKPIQLKIQSYGGGCVAFGRTAVAVAGFAITVRPFDVISSPGPGGICTSDLRFIDHSVSILLPSEGVYAVEVVGVRVYSDDAGISQREQVSFESEITIQGDG